MRSLRKEQTHLSGKASLQETGSTIQDCGWACVSGMARELGGASIPIGTSAIFTQGTTKDQRRWRLGDSEWCWTRGWQMAG